jgi:rod shape-determining protein MreC
MIHPVHRAGRRKPWIKITAAALLCSLVGAALAGISSGSASLLQPGVQTVSQPFLRLFSAGTDMIRQGTTYLKGLQRLTAENQALANQVAALTAQAQAGQLAQGENARLRSLLGLPQAAGDWTLADAWVVGLRGDSWQQTASLDRGTEAGIRPGQWAMDAGGNLVGRVAESGSGWATLTLVTDPALTLAGQGAESEALGQVTGELRAGTAGCLRFTPLGEDQLPQLGETILTFGLETPLTLGRVTAYRTEAGGLGRWAEITPAADLGSLGQVFVVLGGEDET